MKKKFVFEWMYFGQVFIGIGIIFGLKYTGLTIGNLFIGLKDVKE